MYVHNLSPFAIQFTENFGIRWYGLAYLSGFILGYYAILIMTRRGGTLFKEIQIADFITYVAIGVLVGGRLGYCLFYGPELFTSFDSQFPYWGALKVNQGGMASHGGIIGVMIVCWLYARSHKMPVLHLMDLVVFGGSLGFFFGRIANFINGELYGRPCSPHYFLAMKFPGELTLWLEKDFNKLFNIGSVLDALHQFKDSAGQVITVNAAIWRDWLMQYGRDFTAREHVQEAIDAIIKATQHHNKDVLAQLALYLTPRYPSQLFQSLLEGLCVFLILCWIWRRPQKPGVVAGWFGMLYSIARIIGEQYRMPDVQIGYQLFGLTRGQWLSIAFVIFSAAWLLYAYSRKVPRMGGWNPNKT